MKMIDINNLDQLTLDVCDKLQEVFELVRDKMSADRAEIAFLKLREAAMWVATLIERSEDFVEKTKE